MLDRFSAAKNMREKCLYDGSSGGERGKKKRGLHTHCTGSALTVQKVTWNGKIQCLPTTLLGGEGERQGRGIEVAFVEERGGSDSSQAN